MRCPETSRVFSASTPRSAHTFDELIIVDASGCIESGLCAHICTSMQLMAACVGWLQLAELEVQALLGARILQHA
jgi:formate hydrogenlyase subunit 6/NADH:ubiquinone oxidoreductase subunit I